MNQLLIALLISTSLAGVVQGGFVSSHQNNDNQVIDQQSSTNISKVEKNALSDYKYINRVAEETSSTYIQGDEEEKIASCIAVYPELKDKLDSKQDVQPVASENESANLATQAKTEQTDRDDEVEEADEISSNTEKAEKVKENKSNETPVAAENNELNKTIETPIKEEEKTKRDTTENPITEPENINEEAEEEVVASSNTSEQEAKVLTVTATAYTADCEGGTGVTYTGIDLKANPNQKVIAVDPSVIPLGTKVYVEGYGHAIAADIGGAIKGNKIDVFIPSQAKAEDWGIKTVEVKILED